VTRALHGAVAILAALCLAHPSAAQDTPKWPAPVEGMEPAELLLLTVQGNPEPFEKAAVQLATGWRLFKATQGNERARSYALLRDLNLPDAPAATSLVDPLRSYLPDRAGNVLRARTGVFMGDDVAAAEVPAPSKAPTAEGKPPALTAFTGDVGLILYFVKPQRLAEFEHVLLEVRSVLQASASAELKQQARSWRVYKTEDPTTTGLRVYVSVADPAVSGADYALSSILGASHSGDQLLSLYAAYTDAVSAASLFDMVRVKP
jgi:hypothetical protein